MFDVIDIEVPQAKTGVPLSKDEKLTDGAKLYVREQP
jgi:hypothetical protein